MFLLVDRQESVVQLRPSSQIGAMPALHVPLWQLSFRVQPFESASHAVPFATLVQAVVLTAG